MTETAMMRRTLEQGVGHFVESLTLYSEDKRLSAAEHDDIAGYAAEFEECQHSREELDAMSDEDLVRTAYWCMVEYARGQM